MKASEDLYNLIKTLNSSEKGYFKKHSFLGKDKNTYYLKLFDTIEVQVKGGNGYNEELIKQQLSEEKFIKNLPVSKLYLYDAILNALSSYYGDSLLNFKLKDQLEKVEVLFKKGLYEQCNKMLLKVKALAYEQEKYLHLQEIIGWQIKLKLNELNYGTDINDIETLFEEQKKAEKIYINGQEYLKLFYEITFLNRKNGYVIRNAEQAKEYSRILKSKLLANESQALSYAASVLYYEIYIQYYNVSGDYKESYEHCSRFKEFLEKHPEKLQHNVKSYLSALNNYLIRCVMSRRLENFNSNMETYRRLSIENSEISAYLLSYNIELFYFSFTGNFEMGYQAAEKVITELQKYKGRYHRSVELFMYFSIAYLYFGADDYNRSLEYVNKILNDQLIKTREDLYILTLILNLILHFELKNFELLESLIRSTYRYLFKKKRIYKFESIMLDFIKKLTRLENDEDFTYELKNAKKELTKCCDNPFERRALDQFDVLSWIEGKISGRSFGKIVKQNASN